MPGKAKGIRRFHLRRGIKRTSFRSGQRVLSGSSEVLYGASGQLQPHGHDGCRGSKLRSGGRWQTASHTGAVIRLAPSERGEKVENASYCHYESTGTTSTMPTFECITTLICGYGTSPHTRNGISVEFPGRSPIVWRGGSGMILSQRSGVSILLSALSLQPVSEEQPADKQSGR